MPPSPGAGGAPLECRGCLRNTHPSDRLLSVLVVLVCMLCYVICFTLSLCMSCMYHYDDSLLRFLFIGRLSFLLIHTRPRNTGEPLNRNAMPQLSIWDASKAERNSAIPKNETPPTKKDSWADRVSKHQIRGWRAVSAEGLQGEGSRERNVFTQTHTHTHTHTPTPTRARVRITHMANFQTKNLKLWNLSQTNP